MVIYLFQNSFVFPIQVSHFGIAKEAALFTTINDYIPTLPLTVSALIIRAAI